MNDPNQWRHSDAAMNPPGSNLNQDQNRTSFEERRQLHTMTGDRFRPPQINTSPTDFRGNPNYGNYYQASPSGTPSSFSAGPHPGMPQQLPQGLNPYPTLLYPVPQSPYDAQTAHHYSQVPSYFTGPDSQHQHPQHPSHPHAGHMAHRFPSAPHTPLYHQHAQHGHLQDFNQRLTPLPPNMGHPGQSPVGMHHPSILGPGQPGPDSRPGEQAFPTWEAEGWNVYNEGLRAVLMGIQSVDLAPAAKSLMNISEWLLNNVVQLELNQDIEDETKRKNRLHMWEDFNNTWLGLLQRQKDAWLRTLPRPQDNPQTTQAQSLISEDELERMGHKLVEMCDHIERHGLVDYQYGVWEEQIIAMLFDCLDLYRASRSSQH